MQARQWLVASLMVCAVAAPHCSTDSSGTTGSVDASTVPPIAVDTSRVCVTLGPAGGDFTHPAGAQLIVPAGALDTPTSLCLTGIAPASSTPLGGVALAQAYEATPAGQTFHKPVDVVLPFDPTRLSPNASLDSVQIGMAPQGSSDYVALQSSADLGARRVRTQTLHFTQFVPAQNPNPVFITSSTAFPQATVGVAFAQTMTAAGGTAPYTWSLSPISAAPPGLTLHAGGSFDGTPTVPSQYGFFIVVEDAANHSVQAASSLTVVAPSNPVPVLASIAPSTAVEGASATTLTLVGSSFAPTATAQWDGAAISTTFSSATQLSATVSAAQLASVGTHSVTVFNPAPGGGTSASFTFTVTQAPQNPLPVLTSVAPTFVPVSNVDTQITVTGSSFLTSSSVAIGAQGIPTSYVSPTQLLATIPASNLASAGTLSIDVFNPAPGGGFSANTVTITVGTLNAVPGLSSLSPSSTDAGSAAFTLDAFGTSFVAGAQLFFGSTALATTLASDTHASATVPASLVVGAGNVAVTIVNPTPGGGASAPLTFTVTSPGDASIPDAADASNAPDAADASTVDSADACLAPPYLDPSQCGAAGDPCTKPTCGYPGLLCCPGDACAAGTCSTFFGTKFCTLGDPFGPYVGEPGQKCLGGTSGTCSIGGACTGGMCVLTTTPPVCLPLGAFGCSADADCCGDVSGGDLAHCQRAAGHAAKHCCSDSRGGQCAHDADCCSGKCNASGYCAAARPTCAADFECGSAEICDACLFYCHSAIH